MKVENLDLPEDLKQKYTDSGITDLNPPQEKAVESGLMEGKDMIVASPTASGKTFIAELAMANKSLKQGKTAVYIVPLKALAAEKYQDFTERYEDLNVMMSVGKDDDSGDYLETADIVIATSEKLDSMLRHNPSWIHQIGLVVVDEIHLLTSPNRGPTLEVTITRLREILDFQLLGLSATISNSDELAEWLNSELVESTYRPVELEEGIYQQNTVEFFDGDGDTEEAEHEGEDENTGDSSADDTGFSTGNELLNEDKGEQETDDEADEELFIEDKHGRPTQNIVQNTLHMEKQCIIFCSSRKGAEKESDRCAKVTEEDLTRQEEQELEEIADDIENALGNPTSQCKRLAKNVRKGAAFHHAGLVTNQRNLVEDAFKQGLIRSISATPTLAAGVNLPAFRVILRDVKRYTGNGMDFIPVLEYEQQTGRAGRPKYDDRGEAITLAKNPGMKNEILERYIQGEPEKIQSKLAAEPILRMHTLSLVASRYCTTENELLEFYRKTFYAHQYGTMDEVDQKVKQVIQQLRSYEFLEEDKMKATETGKRVSELYIDPDSAHSMIENLEKAKNLKESDNRSVKPVSYLFMLSNTTEMQPSPRVKDKEFEEISQALMDAEKYILEPVPEEWDMEFESFVENMKNSLMMRAWISELDEERIMEKYNIAPGGIRSKMQNADWLLYGAKELVRTKEMDTENNEVQNDLKKLRLRLEHGIKEELLNLIKYDQIGRVRARKLYDHGVRDREDIREVGFEKLKKLIGKRTAKKLKKQVGEENIFDRENVLDYF